LAAIPTKLSLRGSARFKQRFGGKIPWRYPLPKLIAFGLDRLEPGHCIGAIEEDEGKNQLTDI
jgi:hypothetical protein